ncbi:hypothetical protein CWI71_10850 [Pseudidiomarina insulisalsae]|uniref:Uncharacterized protein n=1 Tax=Pseudidiomarina insulisalsae TaxID=575789 RepID=A0A432YAG7_9GAMM|nr:hypothetical protein CWI71_10850 [Pseudidiomarina insulisalsae]
MPTQFAWLDILLKNVRFFLKRDAYFTSSFASVKILFDLFFQALSAASRYLWGFALGDNGGEL